MLSTSTLIAGESVADAATDVSYRDGKLWLALDETPAYVAFAAVSTRTGLTIEAPPSVGQKPVSMTAAGIPVQEAIDRLLRLAGHANYVLVYEPDGRAGRLVIVEGDRESSRPANRVTLPTGVGAPTIAGSTRGTLRSVNQASSDRLQAAARETNTPAVLMTPAATTRSFDSLSPSPPHAAQPIREQLAAWKTLSAAERHRVQEYIKRLPFSDRVEVTLYLRHHILGRPEDLY
jgi:hypothetical protein